MDTRIAESASVDLAEIKSRQQAAWSSGDYAVVGTTLQIVGEMLCEAVDLRSNQRVLDVAAGNGNATLAAARRFADVVSTDYVGALLERGRERAKADRLPGDVPGSRCGSSSLPGCQLRCRPFNLRRHVHAKSGAGGERTDARLPPGRKDRNGQLDAGRLHRQLFKTIGKYVPPAPGVKSPALWGTKAHLDDLFGSKRHRRGEPEFRVPLQVAQALGRDFPRLLRPGFEGVRGDRSGSTRRARSDSTRCSTNSTSPRTARWSFPATISKWSSSRKS